MIRGTTPSFTLKIKNENVDLTKAKDIYVTFSQGGKQIEKSGEDLEIEERTVSVWLTQKESLMLTEGCSAEIQINWIYYDLDGVTLRRAATKIRSIPIDKQLLKRELT